jgi:hypothetical protein
MGSGVDYRLHSATLLKRHLEFVVGDQVLRDHLDERLESKLPSVLKEIISRVGSIFCGKVLQQIENQIRPNGRRMEAKRPGLDMMLCLGTGHK